MKHLGISGGGTKIGGLFGAAEVLLMEKNYSPDIISGISAGAILAVPLALRKFDAVRQMVLSIQLDDFFSQCPVTKKTRLTLRAYWNFLWGKPYLGKQENLAKTIARVVTHTDFEEYKAGSYPDCIVGTVDFIGGGRKYFRLKDLSYEEYLLVVNASASLPVFTSGIRYHGMYLYDGGVRDHISTPWILEKIDGITQTISIYSRPEDYQVLPSEFSDRNLLKILERYTDITNTEVSKNDEWIEDRLCTEKQIQQTKIFLPRIMDSVYDVDREHLRLMYNAGRQAAMTAIL